MSDSGSEKKEIVGITDYFYSVKVFSWNNINQWFYMGKSNKSFFSDSITKTYSILVGFVFLVNIMSEDDHNTYLLWFLNGR